MASPLCKGRPSRITSLGMTWLMRLSSFHHRTVIPRPIEDSGDAFLHLATLPSSKTSQIRGFRADTATTRLGIETDIAPLAARVVLRGPQVVRPGGFMTTTTTTTEQGASFASLVI